MEGFIDYLVASNAELEAELELDALMESDNVDDMINDELVFDDDFANEEVPGELGGNIDGVTNLDLEDDEEDLLTGEYGDDGYSEGNIAGFQDLMQSFEEQDDQLLQECGKNK